MAQFLPPILLTDKMLAPLLVLVGVIAITVLTQLTALFRKDFRKSPEYAHLWKRVSTWWGIFCIFVAVTIFGTQLSLLIWAGCSAAALWHYQQILDLRSSEKRALFWSFLIFIPLQYWWIYIE